MKGSIETRVKAVIARYFKLPPSKVRLDAQKHPERHQNLIVRVCGFSAKFIHLSRRWQDEVIARHRLK